MNYSPSASLTLSSSPARGGAFGVCDTMCQFSVSLHRPQDALNCAMSPANPAGQDGPGKIENNRMAKKKNSPNGLFFSLVSGSYLSSRAVASQVLSAYKGLTSVFGMGTGGTPWLNHRNGYGVFSTHLENCIAFQFASIKPSTY